VIIIWSFVLSWQEHRRSFRLQMMDLTAGGIGHGIECKNPTTRRSVR
jgi:hypothetical protein